MRLAKALETAYEDGYRVFVSGMAVGFDLAAAEAVLKMRSLYPDVRLVAAVPFQGQARGYSVDDRERYETVLAAADQVAVLASRYSHGCYYRRNDWMVDRASRLICWFDPNARSGPARGDGSAGSGDWAGSSNAGSGGSGGGTKYTVKHALGRGLAIVNLFRDPVCPEIPELI